jgi:hypothetical protein
MATAEYGTDLSLIDDAEDVGLWDALGGGQAGLADETDYFIEGTQCVSKAGFTADTKGIMHDEVTLVIPSGDAVFIWTKQNNRNLMDTVANGGVQFLLGESLSVYNQWYIDGNNSDGSDLAGWRNYAIDPEVAPTVDETPADTSFIGIQWKMLGTGALKGNPNGIDISYYGRELQIIEGFTVAAGTFAGAAAGGLTPRWGLFYEVAGGYQQHGAFVMGTVATACNFEDSDVVISVLDDLFVPAGFNEFEIRNASSVVVWNTVLISALGPTSPFLLTLDVGTFTGDACAFAGASTTTLNSAGAMTNSKWTLCDQIILGEGDISGSSILTPSVAADEGAVFDDRTTTAATNITELNDCIFSQGANAHHAIRFGVNVDDDISLSGINFNGFSGTDDVDGSTLRFDATSGSITVSMTGCFADEAAASASNIGIDAPVGLTVVLVFDTVPIKVTVLDKDTGSPLADARVYLHKDGDTGTVYFEADCDAQGEVNDNIAYPGDTDVVGWAREMDETGQDYHPEDISGQITSAGLNLQVSLRPIT